ncbi:MAG: metal-binding protein [Oscillibacter sp.]|nr:metal-binding protein [Oscillibacter sp.]
MDGCYWKDKHYAKFTNRECEFFPCHRGVAEEEFSCLFCYCPLYMLGENCGGAYTYLQNGIKDCSACTFPHRAENYGTIVERFAQIQEHMRGGK